MAAEYLLLGLLREPSSPFDLKAALEDRASHLASSEFADIGRSLATLEERGWVSIEVKGASSPHSELARRTRAGESALMEWLSAGGGVRPNDGQDPLRAHVLDQLGDEGSVRMMLATWSERLELWSQRLVAEERAIVQSSDDFPDGLDDDHFQSYLSVRLELTTTRARISWCSEALRLSGERERTGLPRPERGGRDLFDRGR